MKTTNQMSKAARQRVLAIFNEYYVVQEGNSVAAFLDAVAQVKLLNTAAYLELMKLAGRKVA